MSNAKKPCEKCGGLFQPKTPRRRFCGYSCSGSANAKLAPALTVDQRFWSKVKKGGGCWNWTACSGFGGYGKFGASNTRTIPAHRFSYELHFGPIPSGVLVCHKCDNRKCVRPDHLFLGTHKDNTHDAIKKGRFPAGATSGMRLHPEKVRRGEQQNTAKLNTEKVIYIMAHPEMSSKLLAVKFGVSDTLIIRIRGGKAWRHVTGLKVAPRRLAA